MAYTQLNIIYNVPHPSILIHIRDKLSRNTLLMLTQEIKRDIIFRRMNLSPSVRLITEAKRLQHPWTQLFNQSINLENPWEDQFGISLLLPLPFLHPFLSWNCDTEALSPANPITPDTHAHSATHSYVTLSLSPRAHQYVQ